MCYLLHDMQRDVLNLVDLRPFVLLAGTVVALILLVGGSVALLSAIGSEELPSTLSGGVAGGLKRE